MGLISLDEMELMILIECAEDECETAEEREELKRNQAYARRVLPLVQRHHQLLVTLLLLNSLANESLPLFLDSLVPSWVAIILSVSFILLFGEILPSAIFTGTSGLRISAALSPLVYLSMALTYPIVAPIAWILDRWLHPQSDAEGRYSKAQLLALLRLHMMREGDGYSPPLRWGSSNDLENTAMFATAGGTRGMSATGTNSSQKKRSLYQNEVKMMKGAMALRGTRARDVMTPIEDVFMLEDTEKLDLRTMAHIVEKGHSRIPIYGNGDRNDIRGILLTKKLTALSPEEAREVKSIVLRPPTFVHVDDTLSNVLKTLKSSRSHLAIVTNNPREMCKRFDYRGVWKGNATPADQHQVKTNGTDNGHDANVLFSEPLPPKPAIRPPMVFGVVTLLDIIQQLVDDKLAEEDQYIPPSLADSVLINPSARWSFIDDKPIAVEPRVEVGRLSAWAARSKLSGSRQYSSPDLDQPLLAASSVNSAFDNTGLMPLRKVSFSESVEVVSFQDSTPPDAASDTSEPPEF